MGKEMARRNVVLEKSFAFAVGIVKTGRRLQLEQREWVLSKQLIRSGTSIGANIEEAIAAQSKKDFLSKMSIALKKRERHIIGSGLFGTLDSRMAWTRKRIYLRAKN